MKRLLIANRGEIACRIIRTAKAMGIETVAIHSTIDADAQHVVLADMAYCVGEAPAGESYLRADRVLEIAKRAGADAIHPGYGFLSENADFSRACDKAGITFVGPSADAIEAMGSKSRAKATMQAAGVPVVPGYHGEDQSADALLAAAIEIGFPVLLKASAGGGGKGMRRVDSPDEFAEALAAAKRESLASFGDDHMLIEKCLLTPRHIEVQLMCDQHGKAIYVGDRDCSVQRRHQKIIEEAPAPGLADEVRKAMGEAAVAAAEAINYCGAGTIEFLYQDGAFYFMEMNTRLQVEHPVSEAISGLDLVAMQLAVADGQPLGITQQEVSLVGHAIELRIYAEDVTAGFLPASGRLEVYREPVSTKGLRIDSGVVQGDQISPYYDPMIAKVIGYGTNRSAALARCREALREYRLEGVAHNLDFLYSVLGHASFVEGEVSTAFLNERLDELMQWHEPLPLGAVVALQQMLAPRADNVWLRQPYRRFNLPAQHTIQVAGQVWRVARDEQGWCVSHGDQQYHLVAEWHGDQWRLGYQGGNYAFTVIALRDGLRVMGRLSAQQIRWPVPEWRAHDASDDAALIAPMNGRVVACCVEPNTRVSKGDTLLVMEAMKMEYSLKAPDDGVVVSYRAAAGELVDGGQMLVEFLSNEASI